MTAIGPISGGPDRQDHVGYIYENTLYLWALLLSVAGCLRHCRGKGIAAAAPALTFPNNWAPTTTPTPSRSSSSSRSRPAGADPPALLSVALLAHHEATRPIDVTPSALAWPATRLHRSDVVWRPVAHSSSMIPPARSVPRQHVFPYLCS